MDKILTRRPVNKTASVVTSQSGIDQDESDRILLERKRHEAIETKKIVDARLQDVARGTREHKILKAEARSLTLLLRDMKTKLDTRSHGQKRRQRKKIERYVIEVCKERFSHEEWKDIMGRAEIRMERRLSKQGLGADQCD